MALSSGSGFVMSENGLIVTNAHVVSSSSPVPGQQHLIARGCSSLSCSEVALQEETALLLEIRRDNDDLLFREPEVIMQLTLDIQLSCGGFVEVQVRWQKSAAHV